MDVGSSSDYGDDSFDDLPSPTALLLGKTMGTAGQGKDKPVEAPGIADEFFVGEDWLNSDDSIHLVQTAADHPPRQETGGGRGLVDDDRQSRGKEAPESSLSELQVSPSKKGSLIVEDNSANLNPSPSSSSPNCSKGKGRGAKRKLSQTEPNSLMCEERVSKQAETSKFPHSNTVWSQVSNQERPSAAPGPSTMPTDWEDIDPALLDEFKDIINFF